MSEQTVMKREPVRVLLNGAAGLVNAALVALAVFSVVDIDGEQITAVVGLVQSGAATVGELIRSRVSPA